MKATDKIFVSSDPFGFMHAYGMGNHPPRGEEYIRKDALLEWAKIKLSHLQEDFDVYTGQRIMLRELIEKIESL